MGANVVKEEKEKKSDNPAVMNGTGGPMNQAVQKVRAAPRATGVAGLSSGLALSRLKIGQGRTALVVPLSQSFEKVTVHEVEKQHGGKAYYQCLVDNCPMCGAEWPSEVRALIPIYDLKGKKPCYLDDVDSDSENHLVYQVENILADDLPADIAFHIKRAKQFNDYEVTTKKESPKFFEAESYKRAVKAANMEGFTLAGAFPRMTVEQLHARFPELKEHIELMSGAH